MLPQKQRRTIETNGESFTGVEGPTAISGTLIMIRSTTQK